MQKISKIVNIATICLSLVLIIAPFVVGAQFAAPDATGTGLDGGPDSFAAQGSLTDFIFRVIQIALGLAGLIAVLFLIIGGFRYITAGGNSDGAENGKKTILNAVIGIIVIILSFVVVRVVSNTLTNTTI